MRLECASYIRTKSGAILSHPFNENQRNLLNAQLVTLSSAEREGFEPPEPLSSTVFKTAAIDHSAISPDALCLVFCLRRCKGTILFEISKLLGKIFHKIIFLAKTIAGLKIILTFATAKAK